MTRASLSGSIRAEGSEIGNWALAPDVCESGFRQAFYGVRMFTSHDDQLAFVYVDDPIRGRHVTVNIPRTDRGYGFDQGDCRVLNGSLQRGPLINQVRALSGSIDVDCEAGENRLRGHLSFENCQ
jgi:hypothetical protein